MMNFKNSKSHSFKKFSFLSVFYIIILSVNLIACYYYYNYEKSLFFDNSGKTIQILANQCSYIFSGEDSDDDKIFQITNFTNSVLNADKNVISVKYTDNSGNIVYDEKSPFHLQKNPEYIRITAPVNFSFNGSIETAGYIHALVSKETLDKKIFIFITLIITVSVIISILFSVLIFCEKNKKKNEFYIIKNAIKTLLEGKLGVKINYSDSEMFNEIIYLFNNLSEKLKDFEEQNVENILLERNKFEAILMSILNGVVVCDNNDKVVLLNASAEQILSVSGEAVIDVPVQKFRDNNGNYSFKDKIEEFKDIPLDVILKNPPEYSLNINDKIVKCTISPMFMKNGDYVGYIIVLTDITRETEVNIMKNQFISNVSHELRTPVTVLRTYLDTLNTMSDELDEETRKEFTATADKEVIRLHRMVNEILDVSRLEFPDVEIEKEVENIVPVLEDTITSMQVLANEKGVNIEFEKINEIPDIPFNKPSIERVFNNLISNAIKYSPQNGKITVKITNKNQFVDISVKDEGPGIEAKHLPKLFDRFYRAENNVHTVKGTGLGLYLVKTTVEKHHSGNVYVESTVGKGSTFGIKLPVS